MGSGTFNDSPTTITDSNVNGGTAIDLNAISIKLKIEVFSQAPSVAREDLTTAFTDRLTTGRYAGMSTPSYVLNGKFYASETSANIIKLSYLRELAASNAVKVLSDAVYGTINILITNITVDRVNDSVNGVINYSISFIRVSS